MSSKDKIHGRDKQDRYGYPSKSHPWGKSILVVSLMSSVVLPSAGEVLAAGSARDLQNTDVQHTANAASETQESGTGASSVSSSSTGTNSQQKAPGASDNSDANTNSATASGSSASQNESSGQAGGSTDSSTTSASSNSSSAQSENNSSVHATESVSQKTVEKANIKTNPSTDAAIENNTSSSVESFISEIADSAQKIAEENDLYTSVMIAQAILESASGTSGLAVKANNLFGIKGTYNGQYVTMKTCEDDGSGNYYQINAEFKKYPSYAESLQDYANLLKNGVSWNADYYSRTWESNTSSYQEATAALQGTYATDTSYASKLNDLISEYQLTQYDTGTNSGNGNNSESSESNSSSLPPGSEKSGGATIKTNGVLYVSSTASTPVKTSLTDVTVEKIYSGAKNPYRVTHNGVIVGYLRTTQAGSGTMPGSEKSGGATVKTNGVLYVSSTASTPVKTSLTDVTVEKIYSGAKNPYRVTHNGVIVGYLRTTQAGSGTTSGSEKSGGATAKTNGVLYVSSTAAAPVKTSLTDVTVEKIYSGAKNPYRVTHNGIIVGYLRTTQADSGQGTSPVPGGNIGASINTNGILYVSSLSSNPVKTSLRNVIIHKIYSYAENKYQVTNNGIIVGYLR